MEVTLPSICSSVKSTLCDRVVLGNAGVGFGAHCVSTYKHACKKEEVVRSIEWFTDLGGNPHEGPLGNLDF